MTASQRVENVIQGLRALQDNSLHIIRLSEPISAIPTSHRTSDAFDNPSSESLEADLSHYKVRLSPSLDQPKVELNPRRSSSQNSASPTSNK